MESQLKAYFGPSDSKPTSRCPVPCAYNYMGHHSWAAYSCQDISRLRGGNQPSISEPSSPEALHRKCVIVRNRDPEKTNFKSVQQEMDQLVLQLQNEVVIRQQRGFHREQQAREDPYRWVLVAINHWLHGCLQATDILVAGRTMFQSSLSQSLQMIQLKVQ